MTSSRYLPFLFCLLTLVPGFVRAADTIACNPSILSVDVAKTSQDATQYPEQGWLPTTLPDDWKNRWPGYNGGAWYRIRWACASVPGNSVHPPVALLLTWLSLAGEVYADNELIWRDQHMREPLSRSWNTPQYWLLPVNSTESGNAVHRLWIHVEGVTGQKQGLGPILLGDPTTLHVLWAKKIWSQRTSLLINLIVTATIGSIFLCVWAWRRNQAAALWHALQSYSWTLFGWTVLATEAWPFHSSLGMARASNIAFALFICCFCMFGWRLGNRRQPRVELAVWIHVLAVVVTTLIVPDRFLSVVTTWTLVSHMCLLLAVCVQFGILAALTREAEHVIFGLCLPIFLLAATHDTLAIHNALSDDFSYAPYAGLASTFAMSLILGRRAARNVTRIERFDEEQRAAIDHACAELGMAMKQEHELTMRRYTLQERLQLAQDLHDGIGGQISRSILLAEQEGIDTNSQRMLSMLKRLRDELRQVMDNSRSNMVAAPATPVEWVAPLRHRSVGLFDELGIALEWKTIPVWQIPPTRLQCLALARILEEALTNVMKHSGARRVGVAIEQSADGMLMLGIEDDGRGFDVEAARRAGLGMGMQSMSDRADRIGATFLANSRPGKTEISVSILVRRA